MNELSALKQKQRIMENIGIRQLKIVQPYDNENYAGREKQKEREQDNISDAWDWQRMTLKEVVWIQFGQVHCENNGQNKLEDFCSQPSLGRWDRVISIIKVLKEYPQQLDSYS